MAVAGGWARSGFGLARWQPRRASGRTRTENELRKAKFSSSEALQFSPVHQSRTGEWGSVGTPLDGQHWLASCLPTVLGPKQLQPRLLFRIPMSSWYAHAGFTGQRIQRRKERTATHEAPMASRELHKAWGVALGQVGFGPLRLLDARVCSQICRIMSD